MSQDNNFIPEQESYKKITPFRLFVKSNFPFIEATYEALDNYGLYCKVVEYLNDVIANENTVESNVQALYDAFVSLNTYVSDYFENLDIQSNINIKLDEMVKDGTMEQLLQPYLAIQDAKIENINNKVNAVASGSPAGVYSTLNDLVTADPDHSKIYLVTANGEWYYYNNAWVSGGIYQASENSNQVEMNTRKIDTSNEFNEQFLHSDNKIDSKFYYSNKTTMGDSETYFCYEPIRIKADTFYTVSDFEKDFTNLKYDTDESAHRLISETRGRCKEFTFYAENDGYIYISGKVDATKPYNTKLTDTFTNKDVTTNDYFFNAKLKSALKENVVSIENTDFISYDKQYLNKDMIIESTCYYNINNIDSLTGVGIYKPFIVPAGTYYFKNIYGYFSFYYPVSEKLSVNNKFTTSTTANYSGSITFDEDTIICLTINASNYNKAMFCNNIVPESYIFPYYNTVMYNISIDDTKKLKYYVDINGNGNFTSLVSCINSLNNRDFDSCDIYILEGEYNLFEELGGQLWLNNIVHSGNFGERQGVLLPNNVNLIGVGEVVLKFELPDTATYVQTQCTSALNLYKTNTIENIKIIAKNCRYTIHDETNNATDSNNLIRNIKNCYLEHKGNLSGMWEYPSTYGCGTSSACIYNFENNKIINNSGFPCIGIHTNNNQFGCKININSCVCFCGNTSNRAIRLNSYGTNHKSNTIAIVTSTITDGIIAKGIETSDSDDNLDLYVSGNTVV